MHKGRTRSVGGVWVMATLYGCAISHTHHPTLINRTIEYLGICTGCLPYTQVTITLRYTIPKIPGPDRKIKLVQDRQLSWSEVNSQNDHMLDTLES